MMNNETAVWLKRLNKINERLFWIRKCGEDIRTYPEKSTLLSLATRYVHDQYETLATDMLLCERAKEPHNEPRTE